MRIVKILLMFVVPILFFVAIWRMINLGDNYSFKGIKWFANYFETFPGWDRTYWTFSHAGDYFKFSWGEVIAAVLAPTYLLLKITFAIAWLLIALFGDIVSINIWIFGWIYNMSAV